MEEKAPLRHRRPYSPGSADTKPTVAHSSVPAQERWTARCPRGKAQEIAKGTSAGKPPSEDPIPFWDQPNSTASPQCCLHQVGYFKGTTSFTLLLEMKDISLRVGRRRSSKWSYKANKLLSPPGRSYHGCWLPATAGLSINHRQ